MKTNQPYPEEFKIEAVQQITQRGHKVAEVSARIGVSQHSLYKWIKAYGQPPEQRQAQSSQAEELRHLKAELRRVTEERDILKKAAVHSTGQGNIVSKTLLEDRYGRAQARIDTACDACASA